MPRRKRGKPIHGWVNFDKPFDMTSTQAVGKLRWMFDAQKAGHAGTLDPLATGILPIAFGEATKTAPYAQDAEKVYRFSVRWGAATATDDAEGAVVATSDHRPSEAEILAVLPNFTGEIMQKPPAFSALKVAGARAYDLARDGAPPDLPARPITVHDLRLVDPGDGDQAVFEATTGKGTYVRALARDMAVALGTVGHVCALRRAAVGGFTESSAFTLEELEDLYNSSRLAEALLPVETALDDIPALAVSGGQAGQLKQGRSIFVPLEQMKSARQSHRDSRQSGGEASADANSAKIDGRVLAMAAGKAAAICELDGLSLKPTRVFNH